jgi:hypothetical protein
MSKPCTRCGECCRLSPCGICHAVFGDVDTCPALETVADGFSCGLVVHPCDFVDLGEAADWKTEWFGRFITGLLGVGMGCCSGPTADLVRKQMWARKMADTEGGTDAE